MNYTENYQLNQWEETDRVLMEDFNSDNQKIEAALGVKCEIVIGSYTGNGSATREIYLGFQPRAVMLERQDGHRHTMPTNGGLALWNSTVYYGNFNDYPSIKITETGFQVACSDYRQHTNDSGVKYHYLALK